MLEPFLSICLTTGSEAEEITAEIKRVEGSLLNILQVVSLDDRFWSSNALNSGFILYIVSVIGWLLFCFQIFVELFADFVGAIVIDEFSHKILLF